MSDTERAMEARRAAADLRLVRIQEAVHMIQPGIWTLGGRLQLSLYRKKPSFEENAILCMWEGSEGSWWVLSDSTGPSNEDLSQILPRTIEPHYLAGGSNSGHVVYDLGAAFLKILNPTSPLVTREHVTIDWVQQKKPSFNIPKVLYHGEWEGRYYLVTSRAPGEALEKSWPGLSEDTKAKRIARVTEICEELAAWLGDRMQGVDGGELSEFYLRRDDDQKFDHETLLQNSEELGMDTSVLHFYHCDLGPSNLFYDDNSGLWSIIDWEIVGFVPRQWIRTKFRVSGGMDMELDGEKARTEYRSRVEKSLGKKGFEEISMRLIEWFKEW